MNPMAWVEPFMWGFCQNLGNTMTAVGLLGLLYFAGRRLMWVCDRIIEME